MRVLLIIEAAGGGTGRHLVDLARALHDDGHDVHVVYSARRAESTFVKEIQDSPGVNVATVETRRGPHPSDLISLFKLRRYIKQHGPFDVIHGHSSKAGALARLLKLMMIGKTCVVYTPHAIRTLDPTLGRFSRWGFKVVEKLLGRNLTDAVIAVSPDELQHIRQHGIIHSERSHLVINGLVASPPANRKKVRQRFGIGQAELVFGFVGRFSYQKAPEVAIRAFAKVASVHQEARLVILGFGPQEEMIHAIIASEGLTDRVTVRTRESGFECISSFDVFVMSSRYEGMPYVLLEAAACSLPIIATDVGGVSAIVEDGQNGHVVPVNNVGQLGAAMLNLATNPLQMNQMEDRARDRANDFSADRMVMETIQVYRANLKGPESPGSVVMQATGEPSSKSAHPESAGAK